ncbi:5-(carboxyamino)imidazole ribonucleotide synthase [Cesiribacter andamanensis]|uniref:N5-carboxyaminoimidazole ribonucleotide synthase n=1 Tax=Cesiribacter andamanensis AMV16 TaxID=1279009 RepID=M7NQ35_9BACT|nr:5-(carboxyamino)imidazole ribonucleotide synthase [Cesiribacter andamanensis]EMR00644.1 N5-carboxyaminoimidazole ribonucleotide synthase [Cesiribacter andamanensis AMV16]
MAYHQDIKIGVLGGGQLGRMLLQSAIDFNLELHMLDPDAQAPCHQLASSFTQGALTDYDTVLSWGAPFDVITIEIENVNVEALRELERQGKKVYPQPDVIALIQDKRTQKQFYQERGIPTAPFILTENREDVAQHVGFLPAVHKLGREGYDGRGVQKIASKAEIHRAFDKPGLLEKLIRFEKEIAVIVARSSTGEVKAFPAVEMVFHPEHNLVEYLFAPARLQQHLSEKAEDIALKVAEELKIVGLLAVEMFVTPQGEILVNEVAPRPHNSGHQTIEANYSSQYEQHLRAILGLPLGDTACKIPSAMVNLLGEAGHSGPARYAGLEQVLELSGVHIHLYGKKITKPFRKMGHVTIVDTSLERLQEKARFVKDTLKVIA